MSYEWYDSDYPARRLGLGRCLDLLARRQQAVTAVKRRVCSGTVIAVWELLKLRKQTRPREVHFVFVAVGFFGFGSFSHLAGTRQRILHEITLSRHRSSVHRSHQSHTVLTHVFVSSPSLTHSSRGTGHTSAEVDTVRGSQRHSHVHSMQQAFVSIRDLRSSAYVYLILLISAGLGFLLMRSVS